MKFQPINEITAHRITEIQTGRYLGGNLGLELDGREGVIIHDSRCDSDLEPGDWYIEDLHMTLSNSVFRELFQPIPEEGDPDV